MAADAAKEIIFGLHASRTPEADRVTEALHLLRGKWTVHVLFAVAEHPVRLSELKRKLPTAPKKSLIASLRALEAAGVVVREDLSNSLLYVRYQMTEAQQEAMPTLLNALLAWRSSYE